MEGDLPLCISSPNDRSDFNGLENVGALISHNPMGLHSLLQGQLYLFYHKISKPISHECQIKFISFLRNSSLFRNILHNIKYRSYHVSELVFQTFLDTVNIRQYKKINNF
jgi:hypothetical protein